jgi:hypothetical protein
MQKKLLITYDHELFLGKRSGHAEFCMLRPATELLNVMAPYDIKAIFFVDTTYLLRLKEQAAVSRSCAEDLSNITKQLNEMVAKGHYVFPHIHPHWLDARYDEATHNWELSDVSKYRFHKISHDDRDRIFTGSVNLLKEMFREKHPDYKVNGYRAGGWCIQPFSDFKPFFEKTGIEYDFSVLSGFYQFTDAQYFDFSEAPTEHIYRFSDDICKADVNGPFTQYSIDSVNISAATQLLNKVWIKYLYKIKKDHTFNRGSGQPSHNLPNMKPTSSKGIELGTGNMERIAVESLTTLKLNAYLDHLNKGSYMHFLSHPKMITKHNLEVFAEFLRKAFKRHDIETDFMKMKPTMN